MAGRDKIYGNAEGYDALAAFLREHRPEYLRHLYPRQEIANFPIANFRREGFRWLREHCPLDFVQRRMDERYGSSEILDNSALT